MTTVSIDTLEPGQHFRMPWRPEGANYGTLKYVGPGGCDVLGPDQDGESKGMRWARGTQVIPVTEQEYMAHRSVAAESDRARSAVESPVALVHRLCEEHKGNRDKVIAAAVAAGVNISTAKTQFYAWRKKGAPVRG